MLPCVCLMTNLGRYFVFRTRAASQQENYIDSSLLSLSLDVAVCLQSTPFLVSCRSRALPEKIIPFYPQQPNKPVLPSRDNLSLSVSYFLFPLQIQVGEMTQVNISWLTSPHIPTTLRI